MKKSKKLILMIIEINDQIGNPTPIQERNPIYTRPAPQRSQSHETQAIHPLQELLRLGATRKRADREGTKKGIGSCSRGSEGISPYAGEGKV